MVEGYYYAYISTNPGKSALYTGFSGDFKQRMQRHYQNKGRKTLSPEGIIATSSFTTKPIPT